MEKVSPPPYSEAVPGYPPQPNMQPGFMVPPNQPQPYPGQPNQPQPYPGQTNPPQVIVILSPELRFGPIPQPVTCSYCHQEIRTRIETETVTRTHLFAVVLCIFGCIPCCLIPYCVDSCKTKDHYCPDCDAFLGTYNSHSL